MRVKSYVDADICITVFVIPTVIFLFSIFFHSRVVQPISIRMAFSDFFSSILVILVIVIRLNADNQLKRYEGSIANKHPIQIVYIPQENGKFNSNYSARITDGISYSELLQKQQYVIDKTLLIHSLMKSIGGVTLITYGRRWGKTTNINMIKEFVEIELDEHYKIKPQKETKAYKFFTQGKLTVEEKEISVCPFLISNKIEIVQKHLAAYPVIHITLMELKPDLYDTFFHSFSKIISDLFDRHAYIVTSLKKSVNDDQTNDAATRRLKKKFNTLADGEANIVELQYSIRFLSSLLYEYHGKKVFIFMDEYDTIYNKLFLDIKSKLTDEDAESIRDVMTTFMTSTFKSNPYLEHGIITGVSQIAKENAFSGLNMVQEFSIFSPDVNLFYGIMKDELELLFQLYPNMAKERSAIYSKYDGYPIQHKDFETRALNTFSVTRCLCTGVLDDYWINSGHILGLFKSFLNENNFHSYVRYLLLTTDGNITMSFQTLDSSIDSFTAMKNYLITNEKKRKETNDQIFAKDILKLLLSTAYICGRKMENRLYEITIPNEEIKTHIHRIFLEFYIQYRLHSSEEELEKLKMNFETLILGDDPNSKEFEEKFNSYLNTIPAQFRRPNTNYNWDEEILFVNEELYHDIMTSVAMLLQPKRMGVNFRYGKNNLRPDIFLAYKTYVAVIEIKYGTRENDYIALNQCKSYRPDLEKLLQVEDTTHFRYIIIRGYENKSISVIVDEEKHGIKNVLETIECTNSYGMKNKEPRYLIYKKLEELDIIFRNNETTWTAMKKNGERGLIDIAHCVPKKAHNTNEKEIEKSADKLPKSSVSTSEDAQPPCT